jgi:hypothetical protein
MVIESDSSHSLSWLIDFNNKQAIIKIIDSSVPPSLVALISYVTEIKSTKIQALPATCFHHKVLLLVSKTQKMNL